MVLPSGVTRLAGSDSAAIPVLYFLPGDPGSAGVSMGGYGVTNIAMQNRGVFGQVVPPDVDDRTNPMTALRQAFTSLTDGWRQAAADDAADPGFWNAVGGGRARPAAREWRASRRAGTGEPGA